MAADGYYRATGKVAAIAVTSGPGVQNVLNGVCGCWYDSVPALVISGQVNMRESLDSLHAAPRQVGFQETPVVECFRPFTKYIAKMADAASVPAHLARAMLAMTSGRPGPALLDYPVNVQMTEVEGVVMERPSDVVIAESGGTMSPASIAAVHPPPPPTPNPPPAALTKLLEAAARPVLILGNGARASMATLRPLLARLGFPVVVTWGGLDLVPAAQDGSGSSSSSPPFLGQYGVYGNRVANFAVQNADLLLVLGARMDTRQTGGNLAHFSRASAKVMVDVDGQEIAKLVERGVPIDAGYVMDVGAFVADLLQPWVDGGSTTRRVAATYAPWTATLAAWQAKYGVEDRPCHAGHVSPYACLAAINAADPHDAVFAVDTGATLVWAYQTLRALSPGARIFSNLGNSSMGFALPAAIGAGLGKGAHHPVLCITGDGGFQQNIQELVTAAHCGLNIKVFVFNNSGYGIIKQFQNSYLGGRHAATGAADIYGKHALAGVNFVEVAQAYGVAAHRVTSLADLSPKLVETPGLAVFDVVIHESQGIQPKLDFGNALENMSPFIESGGDMVVDPAPCFQASGWVKL